MISTSRADLVDRPFSAYVLFEDQDIYYRHLRKLFDSNERQVCELRLKQRSGEYLYVQMESNVASDESEETKLSRTMVSDITLRKQAEDERLALEQQHRRIQNIESIGILAGGIAHDFNNILFPIMGYTEMAMQDLPENHPLQKSFKAILHGAIRASNLVKQILLFSSQRHDEEKPVPLQPLIVEVLSLLRSTIPADIKIEHNLDEKLCNHALCLVMGMNSIRLLLTFVPMPFMPWSRRGESLR